MFSTTVCAHIDIILLTHVFFSGGDFNKSKLVLTVCTGKVESRHKTLLVEFSTIQDQ